MATTSTFSTKIFSCMLVTILFAIVYSAENSQTHNVVGAKNNGSGYFVSDFPLSWFESREYCLNINKTLLTVPNVRKDESLVEEFVSSGNTVLPGNVWVAGKERAEGVWEWDTGVDDGLEHPFYHTRWFVGQPDDLPNLNCVYLAKTALLYWRDANCSAPMYFVCE